MSEKTEPRTLDKLNEECANALLELGRNSYQHKLLEQEIKKLHKKIYDLNVEALAIKNSIEDKDESDVEA
jgi:hypothetical protein